MKDGIAKVEKNLICVIPAQAGIQEFKVVINHLDTRFGGYDDFLRIHQIMKEGIKKAASEDAAFFS